MTNFEREQDPVVSRRAKYRAIVKKSKNFGYLCLLIAIAGFAAAVITDFDQWAVTIATGGLIGSFVVLPIPIVLSYGIAKAEREDPGL